MDATLHCNELKCRAAVTDRAVVTTCSHILCLNCAERLDLSNSRQCPVCDTFLPNPDDASVASLNPTEDYKSSILSGLSPTIIMECAGRGLSFWAYQMSQEITYQEYLGKKLSDRYSVIQGQLEGTNRKVEEDNRSLRMRMEAMLAENAQLTQKLESIEQQYKKKDTELKKMQVLLNSMRSKQLNPHLESAANREIDEVIQAGAAQRATQQQQERSRESGVRRTRSHNSTDSGEYPKQSTQQHAGYATQMQQSQVLPDRSTIGTANSQLPSASQNRRPLQAPAFGSYNSTLRPGPGIDRLHQGTPLRGQSGVGRYVGGSPGGRIGLSANARSGRPQLAPHLQVPVTGIRHYGASRQGYPAVYR